MRCPRCGHEKEEVMPRLGAETRYQCTGCRSILTAKKEECCVYCLYSNTLCPPRQEKRNCCSD